MIKWLSALVVLCTTGDFKANHKKSLWYLKSDHPAVPLPRYTITSSLCTHLVHTVYTTIDSLACHMHAWISLHPILPQLARASTSDCASKQSYVHMSSLELTIHACWSLLLGHVYCDYVHKDLCQSVTTQELFAHSPQWPMTSINTREVLSLCSTICTLRERALQWAGTPHWISGSKSPQKGRLEGKAVQLKGRVAGTQLISVSHSPTDHWCHEVGVECVHVCVCVTSKWCLGLT